MRQHLLPAFFTALDILIPVICLPGVYRLLLGGYENFISSSQERYFLSGGGDLGCIAVSISGKVWSIDDLCVPGILVLFSIINSGLNQ